MAFHFHTYGPSCRLHTDPNKLRPNDSDKPPAIRTHFFHSSTLPIDDPLSILPTSSKPHTSYPFSTHDNGALEEAWQGLFAKGSLSNATRVKITQERKDILLTEVESAPSYDKDIESREPQTYNESDELAHAEISGKLLPQMDAGVKEGLVPVGLSGLHVARLADMKMEPIYWSPVNDISSLVRGTWFYRQSMLPIEPDIANLLEKGYEEIKPWTTTYDDEVRSCLAIGPEAEIKLTHKLFSTEALKRPTSVESNEPDMLESAGSIPRLNMAVGSISHGHTKEDLLKYHEKSHVIYKDGGEAQILRPNQMPSATRGRKPLSQIKKGRFVGTPVVRGFDPKAWDRIYPQREDTFTRKAREAAVKSQSRTDGTTRHREVCHACLASEVTPGITDLMLVIHGIGQKRSERDESFMFTHVINNLRRQVALTLESEQVQPALRENLGGIMVLPVNWRAKLKLEDENSILSPDKDEDGAPRYTLEDVTGPTIPAIRELINDVMLDIPYYLSQWKPQMLEAVINEANRVYRLWCTHNTGFEKTGRVHLVAHSLGSVMALDILSTQPTHLPETPHLGMAGHRRLFDFDTKNIFFCGSPVGFFLHLQRAKLLPRKNRAKPGSETETETSGLGAEVGTFGCMAVDNVYNIIHPQDPVAYRMNPCVDLTYAKMLKPATVPNLELTWLRSIFRAKPQTLHRPGAMAGAYPVRPLISKLPSAVELDVHDFTMEEIAEKKMHLVNDNGQVDFFLNSTGMSEYLNMLGAHSSYWTAPDFVLFLVLEVGRKPGRHETLPALTAQKEHRWKR